MRRGRADLKNSINRAGSAQIILRRMEAFKMPRFETKSREQERARGSREVFFFFLFLSHRFCRSLEIRLADLIFIFPTESFFYRRERFARIGIDFDHGNLRNFVMDKKRTDEYSGRSDDKSEKIERPRNHDRRR